MAPPNTLPIYGLDRELAAKAAAKYDPQRENEAKQWIEDVIGEKLPQGTFNDVLKDGIYLCKLVMKVSPDQNIKFNTSKMPFKQMENINLFLQVSEKLGVPKTDLFQTIDLFENKNMNQVIDGIFAFSRNLVKKGFQGPCIGPRLAEKHEVQFTEEQLQQGKHVLPFQTGFTGGIAGQANISGGTRRQILDPTVGQGDVSAMPFVTASAGAGNGQANILGGARRQILDPNVGQGDRTTLTKLTGWTDGATATGVVGGGRRDIGGEDPGKK